MTKYTFEFKLKIVKEYLDKRTGYHSLSKNMVLKIPNKSEDGFLLMK
ncbi:hypothetical protein LLT7_05825 [Lactococcus cremoris subsp. cremoris TIFN7]|nr:hypothetical protein LLT7_05825 [Lactococcus cremoris subsp. cremoris TIFN7]